MTKTDTILTEAQIDRFQTDGVVKLEGVLSTAEVRSLQAALAAQMAEKDFSPSAYDFDDLATQIFSDEAQLEAGSASRFAVEAYRGFIRQDPEAEHLRDETEAGGGRFFYDAVGWRRHRAIAEMALDSVLPGIVAGLMKSRTATFWEDTTFVKEAGTATRTAFHQDRSYANVDGTQCCVAWIPLDVVDEQNGALEYVRGSHRDGRDYAPNVLFSQARLPGSKGERVPDIEGRREEFDLVHMDARPGDVVIHDFRTLHGAGGNRTANRGRRAISFRNCGDDAVYRTRPGALPPPWDRHVPGENEPLLHRDYPLVWPRLYPQLRLADLYDAETASQGALAA